MGDNADVTEDGLLGGRVRLRQPARGYRANADTVLLAAAVEAVDDAHFLEAGCGVGGALLCVAARAPRVRVTGVERDGPMAALARENAVLNGWADRIDVIEGDVIALDDLETFDGVFFNPPFDDAARVPALDPTRRGAHIAEAPIGAWIKTLVNHMRGGAALTLIHRATALPEILAAFEGRLGGIEAFPIFPRRGAGAKRVLARARKGARAPFTLYRGLVLHDESEATFTPEAEAIFRDGAAIAWR